MGGGGLAALTPQLGGRVHQLGVLTTDQGSLIWGHPNSADMAVVIDQCAKKLHSRLRLMPGEANLLMTQDSGHIVLVRPLQAAVPKMQLCWISSRSVGC